MKRYVLPLVFILLITGGCGGRGSKEPKTGEASEKPDSRKITIKHYSLAKAPQNIRRAADKYMAKETGFFLRGEDRYWVLVIRGEKPTGGYDVTISDALLSVSNGESKLTVKYRYSDPPPGQFVTQSLTYPKDLVLLEGLEEKPDKTEFIKIE